MFKMTGAGYCGHCSKYLPVGKEVYLVVDEAFCSIRCVENEFDWPGDDHDINAPRKLEFLRGDEAPKEDDEDQDIPF